MDTVKGVVLATLVTIAATLLASGPLVPAIDFTNAEAGPTDERSQINATVERPASDSFSLRQGRYGTNVYFLEAPAVVINVTSISGTPTVVYEVEMPTQNRTLSTVTFLDPDTEPGPLRLAFEAPSIDSEDVRSDSYPGIARVFTRVDEEKTVLYNRSITISVED
jgi:hypothetical protein